MTLPWIVVAVALLWGIWRLFRVRGSASGDGDASDTYYSDGGGSASNAECSDSGSDGGSCDGGGDGGDGGGGD